MSSMWKRVLEAKVRPFAVGVVVLSLGAILVFGACGSEEPTEVPTPTQVPTVEPTSTPVVVSFEDQPRFDMDVTDVDGWINSDPVTIAHLVNNGKVVLVDFWTYTCVNCLRTLPFLRDWQEKYADNGLVILGIHAPEFDFEKELENVQMSVDDEGIEWPVALDNDMRTWRSFNNRYWPAKYLIGAGGEVLYEHFGEGAYRETELEIREALEDAGYDVSTIPIGEVENTPRDSTARTVTRELYGGYDRNYSVYGLYAAQDEYYIDPDVEVEYEDKYAEHQNYPAQQWVVNGLWRNEREAIVHARETDDLSDYLAFRFQGRSANVVIDPPEPDEFNVYVEIDGRPLMENEAGDDIEFDEEGRSFFHVNEGRMYKIVEVPEYTNQILKLSSDSENFAIFAFTFGIYEGGF